MRTDPLRLINTLCELCSIPSPSRAEHRIGDHIMDLVRNYGAEIVDDGRSAGDGTQGNIIVACPGDHPERLFLSAHIDTVPVPPGTKEIEIVREDGRIRTNGTTILGGDDKSGVAAALEMIALCGEAGKDHRGLEVVLLVQEEIGCRGSRGFDPARLTADTGFNLDGETPPFSAVVSAPFKTYFECTVAGRSAHAALNPDDGVNAIVGAAELIEKLPIGAFEPGCTANVGAVSGGGPTNVVPDRASVTGELRCLDRVTFLREQKNIERTCAAVARRSGTGIEIRWEHAYDGYSVTPDQGCRRWFAEACRSLGREPEFLTSPGGGDSNNLNAAGLPNIVFGMGMHRIHSTDEYVVESEIIAATELLERIVFP